MTTNTDLASRLLAAIDETGRLTNGSEVWWAPPDNPGTVDTGGGGMTLNVHLPSYAAHIAHHHPAAVLRRCAADRRIVERFRLAETEYHPDAFMVMEETLRDLAAGYGITDHHQDG